MSAQQLVQDFCDAMVKRDAEGLRQYLADNVVYQNVGMEASTGIDAVIAAMAMQFEMFPDSYEYRTVNIVAERDTVLTERIDYLKSFDGSLQGLPVMGTFIVSDDRIVRWTDYWDTALIGKMLSGEDTVGLVPSHARPGA